MAAKRTASTETAPAPQGALAQQVIEGIKARTAALNAMLAKNVERQAAIYREQGNVQPEPPSATPSEARRASELLNGASTPRLLAAAALSGANELWQLLFDQRAIKIAIQHLESERTVASAQRVAELLLAEHSNWAQITHELVMAVALVERLTRQRESLRTQFVKAGGVPASLACVGINTSPGLAERAARKLLFETALREGVVTKRELEGV